MIGYKGMGILFQTLFHTLNTSCCVLCVSTLCLNISFVENHYIVIHLLSDQTLKLFQSLLRFRYSFKLERTHVPLNQTGYIEHVKIGGDIEEAIVG